MQEKWSNGLEWDLVEFILEVYRISILEPLQHVKSPPNKTQMNNWSGPSASNNQTIVPYPREVNIDFYIH